MITQLTLKNFKSIGEQVYDFTDFNLLVGRNNSGKSTVLQAMAIWQYCVDEFHRAKRTGSTGIQVVLPNFTALPVPEFNLLWKDKDIRRTKEGYILIGIHIEWNCQGINKSFGVDLRYQSPQTIYAIPHGGWDIFREHKQQGDLPKIAYVPPFSGLETNEKWLDISPIRQQVGKGQPGSVLRNLLLQVSAPLMVDGKPNESHEDDWQELESIVRRWFGVKILKPKYDSQKDVFITVEYQHNNKNYDIISAGSGFHQTLTLLAFLYGYKPSTILLDEPDAHLHVNLQREILDFFKRKSIEKNTQFLIATHAEEFVRGVDGSQIISLLNQSPKRIFSAASTLHAMSEVTNEEIVRLMASPYIVYVEGESDERILRAWAEACMAQDAMDKVCFKMMGGGNKVQMKERAEMHFKALRQIIPSVKRLKLFDFDEEETSFHPKADDKHLFEWKRKNIENYLLVPDAWKRLALKKMQLQENDLFAQPVLNKINEFFAGENLTLPNGKTWRNVSANIFISVDGKRILFEDKASLFQILRNNPENLMLLREEVAMCMLHDDIHEDVHQFMSRLINIVSCEEARD